MCEGERVGKADRDIERMLDTVWSAVSSELLVLQPSSSADNCQTSR